MRAIRRFNVRIVLPEALVPIEGLAANLRWSWDPETRDLFSAIDADLWQSSGHDPVRLLSQVSTDRWHELAHDASFVDWLWRKHEDLQRYLTDDRWYQTLGDAAPRAIAYFSPEYGITSVMPQYSGGLGILAGDHLKTASDLGVPIIGVGLFYHAGYFRQSLSREGWQLETYPVVDPDGMPVRLLRDDTGTPVKITIALPGGRELLARIWVADVGRVPLLLLDTDVEGNGPAECDITDRLYGGGAEHRLLQEILLGVGGVRAIRQYCDITGHPQPEVFHTNEGHAGFLGIERIRELVAGDKPMSFDEALEVVRAGTVFTTHTPVPAGIDRFPRELIEQYIGELSGVPIEQVLALGAESFSGGDPAVFNMAVMGLRLAQRANGVSLLHGQVSRGMFAGLWPNFDADDVPITSITNGVHAPTWVARPVRDLAHDPQLIDEPFSWAQMAETSDEHLWAVKRQLREQLTYEVRRRLRESWLARGASEPELGWVDNTFDPDILTIGFARRVPSYKRLTLMLRDPDRLEALLTDPDRPVQLVIAGKAHPADEGGKRLIQELVTFADRREVRHRIVFLPDYDMGMATIMYPGCDVWLNNPIRPLEASGTSGMKAALNGALNLSILDGWWDEWFDGRNGWAIPTADGVDDEERRDDLEAAGLYDLIANAVAPAFYDRDEHGLPRRWIGMVKHTLATLGPKVLASRMVREYVEKLYQPAGQAQRLIEETHHELARELAAWKTHLRSSWPSITVEHVEADGVGDNPMLGNKVTVRAYVSLGALSVSDVDVQLVYGHVDADDVIVDSDVVSMDAAEEFDGNRWRFEHTFELARTGPFGYTVRVFPHHRGLASVAELGLVATPQGLPEPSVGNAIYR